MDKMGLTDQVQEFKYEDEIITTEKTPLIEVHKVRPVYRIGREGKLTEAGVGYHYTDIYDHEWYT